MGLLRAPQPLTPSVARETQGGPLVEATGLGVRYLLGSRREDIQSLTYDFLFWRQKQKRKAIWALRDVHLVAYPGDIVGIIGANGAGKTTLCRVLSGLLRPDAGEIRIKAEVSALLSLGTGFNIQLSGRENIFLNGLMLGLARSHLEDLLSQIVNFSGLGRFIDQPLKHYSTGMKARLGFSIAAAIESEILIVDEALAAGDRMFSEKAGQRMQELISESKMVIVVTHAMDFVEKYCTKVLWLDQGSVRASGRPQEVVPLYTTSIPQAAKTKRIPELRETRAQSGTTGVVIKHLGVKYSLLRNKQDKRLRGKNKTFWALRDVSLSVNEGEIIGVIGPNGAGKTTLCRVLSGVLKADRGMVLVDGKITALLGFGMGFNHQLTGRDNVYLNGMMLGVSKRKLIDLYPDIVEFSGLARFMDEPIKHYSSGMRSRLGFSIAAVIEPEVFVIDEALSLGDIAFYEKASAKIQELIACAKAVIVVTHDLAFVEKVCTRALWLDSGTVQFDGGPKEAVARYHHSFKSAP